MNQLGSRVRRDPTLISGTKIYLAGKVTKNGWRNEFVRGLRDAYNQTDYSDSAPWPILTDALGPGLHYVGPYFVSCDHGCAHEGAHAFTSGGCLVDRPYHIEDPTSGHGGLDHDLLRAPLRRNVANQCLKAITTADTVIAVIEPDAHGTLVEVGYAVALGKEVFVIDPYSNWESGVLSRDAWFPFAIYEVTTAAPTVADAIGWVGQRNKVFREQALVESPIELSFLKAMRRFPELNSFVPQVPVADGKYRLDFGDPTRQLGIELDGYEYHSTKDQFIKDRQRHRDIEELGWRLTRFAGSEVHADANKCALQTINWLSSVT